MPAGPAPNRGSDDYEVSVPEGAACAFCLQPVALGARTACPRCRSLYHPDCWKANDGRCAVYGCESVPAPPPPTPHVHAPGRSGSGIQWGVMIFAALIGTNIFKGWVSSHPPASQAPVRFESSDVLLESAEDSRELKEADAIFEQAEPTVKALEERLKRPVDRDEREELRRRLDSVVHDLGRARALYVRHGSFGKESAHRRRVGEISQTIDRLTLHCVRLTRP